MRALCEAHQETEEAYQNRVKIREIINFHEKKTFCYIFLNLDG